MEAGNCPCIKLVKVLLKKLQNDLFKVLYVPWITAYVKSEMRSLNLGTTAIALSNVVLGMVICGGGD